MLCIDTDERETQGESWAVQTEAAHRRDDHRRADARARQGEEPSRHDRRVAGASSASFVVDAFVDRQRRRIHGLLVTRRQQRLRRPSTCYSLSVIRRLAPGDLLSIL